LDRLPLFATDRELAIAVVGKDRATMWIKAVIPQLERKGFPRIEPLHDGRPVPLVKKFYNGYFGITAGFAATAPDGEENLGVWDRSKRELRNDRKPRLGLDGRSQTTLLFMVSPDAQTHVAIPGAGAFTMDRLAEKGAIAAKGKDREGDTVWIVTDSGVEEAKLINFWHHGKTQP
jgi:hypothetical protein